MKLTTILECFKSRNLPEIKKIIDSSVYILDVNFSKETGDYLIIYLGQAFRRKNNKVFELYYEHYSGTIIHQLIVSNNKKFLGQFCGFDPGKSYIKESYCIFFSKISSDNDGYEIKYFEHDFDQAHSEKIRMNVFCKYSLDDLETHNHTHLEIYDFLNPDKEGIKYPINFELVDV